MAGESRGEASRGQTVRRAAAATLAVLAAGATVSGCVLRRDRPAPVATDPAVIADARAYLAAAMESDLFEVVTSRLALERTQNPEVRAYAAQMIEHHTLTTNAALAAARAGAIPPAPPVLTGARLAEVRRLQSQVGFEFDRSYIDAQVPAHGQALELHSRYSRLGAEPRLRRSAAAAVPYVVHHLAEARRLQARLAVGL